MGGSGFGLSALMEAVKYTEEAMYGNTLLMEAMDEGIDEDLKVMIGGGDCGFLPEESLEAEMAGLGIDDDEKMEKLIALIPEDDDGIEEEIQEITEGFFGSIPDNYLPVF